ncbi:hypothetical protein RRG08_045706 [Elysia crispata]|uniref:Uncharacterized protein n=1 Tax=Elysia crispata TaxID=231223 RepID=A0AAE0Z233_9GAST|nr:hypothetical protein RRG08_045706 [Elysia crispata]
MTLFLRRAFSPFLSYSGYHNSSPGLNSPTVSLCEAPVVASGLKTAKTKSLMARIDRAGSKERNGPERNIKVGEACQLHGAWQC